MSLLTMVQNMPQEKLLSKQTVHLHKYSPCQVALLCWYYYWIWIFKHKHKFLPWNMFNIIYRKHGNKYVRKRTDIKKPFEQMTVIWLVNTIYLLRAEPRGSIICDQLWEKWYWDRLFSRILALPCTSPFHDCSMFIHLSSGAGKVVLLLDVVPRASSLTWPKKSIFCHCTLLWAISILLTSCYSTN
jgi:hypothetical protein